MIVKFLWRNGWLFFLLLAGSAAAQKTKDVVHPRLLLPVRQGMKWGYADTAKNIIITPQFDAANNFSKGIAIVEKNKKAFAIDESGKILTPPFDQMAMLQDSLLQIYLNEVSDTLGGWGICTKSGRVILPPAYDEITTIDADLFAMRKDSLWGVVNRDGRIYCEPAYNSIILTYGFGGYLELHKGKKIGLMGHDGTRYLDDIYSRIYVPDKFIVAGYLDKPLNGNKKGWGAYDHYGNLFIPFGQDSIFRISSHFVGVSKKDSLACYFSVAPGKNTSRIYKQFLAVDLYWAELIDFNKKCGLADTMGNIIVPVNYSSILIGGRGFWFARDTANKWAVYNNKGEMIVSPAYSSILPFRGNVTIVFDGKLQGLINDLGEMIIPPGDQQIIIRGTTVKVIRKNNTASFIRLDANGRIIDQSDYDEFRVIKISGTEAPVSAGSATTPGAAPVYFPPIDSLDWFIDLKTSLWGLRNTYTNDTVIFPRFNAVDVTKDGFTVVSIHKPSTGIIIDGITSVTSDVYGLVNNKTGQLVLKPVYSTIRGEDLAPKKFKGFVRATLANGAEVLATTDGSERTMSYTFIDNIQNGYARFCIEGKWTIEDPGEMITNIAHFCTEQSINIGRTFGVASTSKEFMEKNLCIAGGKWGYLDSTGHIIITPAFDGAKQVVKETAIVKSEKKWGMIDMKGATRIPLAYDALYYMTADTNTFVIAQMNGIRYGYIDRNGNIKIPADLKLSKPLGNGFIGFSKTGKWGVMNSQGNLICNEHYHEILPFSEGYAAVRLGNKWGYIDTLGAEVIAPSFEKAGQFCSGYARVVKNYRWGFIDKSGMIIIEPKYMQAGNFSGNAAPVRSRDGFGLMSKEGKWLQRPAFVKVTQLDSSLPGFFVLLSTSGAAVCNSTGKIIIPSSYEAYKYLGEGIVGCRNGNYWALADTSGKIITNLIFEGLKPFSEHYAAALQNGLWGFIGKKGTFIIQPKYRVVGKFMDHMAYAYSFPDSYIIDTLGNTRFAFDKGSMSYMGYSEGKFLIGKLNQKKEIEKQYFVTRHGVKVNRIEYREAILFQDGAARVRVDGPTWGLVSFTGYYLVKPRFFALSAFEYGLARFQMRYTVGAFSLEGKQVLPVGYDAIYYDSSLEKIRYEKGNALGYLFVDGSVCWPEGE
jgi:hypothetical protein